MKHKHNIKQFYFSTSGSFEIYYETRTATVENSHRKKSIHWTSIFIPKPISVLFGRGNRSSPAVESGLPQIKKKRKRLIFSQIKKAFEQQVLPVSQTALASNLVAKRECNRSLCMIINPTRRGLFLFTLPLVQLRHLIVSHSWPSFHLYNNSSTEDVNHLWILKSSPLFDLPF